MTPLRGLLASPVFFGWLAMAVRALVPLLGAAYGAQTLSPEEAVVFWLALSIFSITGLLDLGFTPTFIRYLAYALAPGAAPGQGHPVGSVLKVQARIYAVLTPSFCLVLGMVLAFLLRSQTGASESSTGLIQAGLILLGATATFYSAKARAILQGAGQVVVQKRIEALAGLFNLLGFLLLFSAPLSAVLGIFALTRVLELAGLALQARRLRLAPAGEGSEASAGLRQEVVSAALRSGLGVLATGLVVEGTALLASQVLAPAAAAQYMMSLRFVLMLAAFAQLPFQVAIPALVTRFSLGERGDLVRTIERLRSVVLGVLVLGAFLLPLLLEAAAALGLRTASLAPELWSLLVLYALMERGGAVNIQAQTLNKVVNWHKVNGLTGLVSLLLVTALGKSLGAKGFALAFVLAYGLVYFPYSVWLRFQVYGRPLPLWDRLLAGLLLAVLLLLGAGHHGV